MKRIFLIISLLFLFAGSALATTITVSSTTLQNWRFGGTTARLRIFADTKFVTSTAQIIMPGQVNVGNWYKEVNCTVAGTVLTIPSFTIDSTTDSSVTRASYTFVLFDNKNIRRDTYADSFRIPHTLGATLSWVQLITYNQASPRPATPGVYNSEEVNTLIADLATLEDINDAVTAGTATLSSGQSAQVNSIVNTATGTLSAGQTTQVNSAITSAVANKVNTTDSRLERELSKDYSGSFATANSMIGSSLKTILRVNTAVSVSSSVSINPNICVDFGDDGSVSVASGQTLTINCMANPGNRAVFTSSLSGAKVLFGKGAVDKINLAWWTVAGANITDALSEALESANANQSTISIPVGQWYTSGGHDISSGVIIEGTGNFQIPIASSIITLQSPSTTYLFKIGETKSNIRLRNLQLDGNGTSGKDGLLLEGTAPNTSNDVSISHVSFYGFQNGINLHSLPAAQTWQVSQIKIDQSIFFNNKVGIKQNSVNSEWALESTNFFIPGSGWAFDLAAAGIMNIKSSEFGGLGDPSCGIIHFTGAHGAINFIGSQDEGCFTFLQNDASDITGVVNLFGNLIQSKIVINQSMTLSMEGNNVIPDAIRIAPGAFVRLKSSNDIIRTDAGTPEAPGTVPAATLRLMNTNNSSIQSEQTIGTTSGDFRQRYPQKFYSVFYQEGNPSYPIVGIGQSSQLSSESKTLLRLGRIDTNQEFDFYYDFLRQNSGEDAGRLKIKGNQTFFAGFDLEGGDLFVKGAIRGQANGLTDGATIAIDPRTGNHQYVTLQGNRTFVMATLSTTNLQDRADGQRLTIEIIQDSTGSRSCTLQTGIAGSFAFGTDIPSITCSTAANKRDILTAMYSKRMDRWLVVSFVKGF